ncbi:N-acetylmuramoyl-L-alanine amidase, partial [Ilumatobacter nonamiensis]|uniref:N-acetylmuramoyl-L-alanine amidase n=1 Tax=Ilumatobacter nonamiensis TaxID=467093 RepID=UPI00058E6EE4
MRSPIALLASIAVIGLGTPVIAATDAPIDDSTTTVEDLPTDSPTDESTTTTEVPVPSSPTTSTSTTTTTTTQKPAGESSTDDLATTTTTSKIPADDVLDVDAILVTDDQHNVAVEWRPYTKSEPAHLGSDPSVPRQMSQDLVAPALMTGLSWTSGDPTAIWLQQHIDGEWGAWEQIVTDHGHDHGGDGEVGDDSQEAATPGTDVIILDEPDAVRFLVEGAIVGAKAFVFVDQPSPEARQLPTAQPLEPIASNDFEPLWPGPSFVRDRSEWDTTNCRVPDADFNLSSSEAVIVHHSAGSSNYSQAQVPAVLRGLCAYQTGSSDLDDVGYNFVIDRFGTVWEGRTGSKRAPIQSAHARGFNYNTQGVVLLGNYDPASPPAAQLNGLQQLLDWLTGWYGIEPAQAITLIAGSDGQGFNEGDTRTVNGVAGHREVGQTSCPGGAFFPQLNSIAANTRPTNFGTDADQPLREHLASSGLARFVDAGSRGAGRVIEDYNFREGWTSITNVDLDG